MNTALYTTVHPASAPYLGDFFRSVQRQTDRAFDLWIGTDGLEPETIAAHLESLPETQFVVAERGDTPASLRQRAWRGIVTCYDSVIFVDSDDVLYPTRVAAAKEALQTCDVYGCALNLITQEGAGTGLQLQVSPASDWSEIIPSHNVFGLSNTAYRSEVLAALLPVPPEVALVDWFLVTQAYLAGARLQFDPVARMDYRQYSDNTARVLPPFTPRQIVQATDHVLKHYSLVLSHLPTNIMADPEPLRARFREVQKFAEALRGDALEPYTQTLNSRAQPVYLWWECVAHKELSYLWNL